MRIGLSTSVIQRGRSGVGQYVLALVRALLAEAERHDFFLFVLEEDRPLFDFVGDAMQIIPVAERFRPPVQDIRWHQFELPRLVRAHELDVLHVPSYRRMLWPRPCPLVATVHDLAAFRVPKKYDWLRMFYGRYVVRQLAWRQDEIVAVSRATASDLQQFFGLPATRVTVIHNGLNHARFTPAGRAEAGGIIAQRYGLRPPFFLYVARLEYPAKNHGRLIAAFNQFKTETPSPWQLVLLGSDWHGASMIHELVRRSPYAQDIHCPGFVKPEELPTWYRAAGAFVYPSLFEGFGLPPLEAMACGCPVACSNAASLPEIVGDAARLFDPNDPSAIADAIRDVLAAPEEWSARGLERARLFSWDATARAHDSVYRELF
jgi:glycosyltransferase involved in cell wall biosynthesis